MSDFKAKITAELDTSRVEQQIKEINNKKVKLSVDTGSTQKQVDNINKSLTSTTTTTQKFGDTLKKSMNIGTAYSITANGLRLISSAAKEATEAVKGFDDSITNLRMATGQNYESVSKLVKGYNALGQEMGAVTTEVADSANSWLRQGHDVVTTNTLIKDSMILSKVANIDAADSTQYLTSAMKGYKVEAENVIGIVDKLTSVDLVSATDAAGLAEAMSRTAQTANSVGVSMDKLLGYLAATGEVTQKSMSSIGESFKTIFMRMSSIKAGKLELIDEDGTAESLSDVETVLSNVGIQLRESNNEFRNFGVVLDEVGASWDGYSTVQQAAISKAFAGTRQAENFRVLMENYTSAINYMEVSMNSAGTAEKKFEAYLGSLDAKTKSLQASFESLAINTISTESVGGIIEATTSVIDFLDKTNLVKGTLAGLVTGGIIKGFTMLKTGISSASMSLNQFNSALELVKAGNIGEKEIQRLAQMTDGLSVSQMKAVLSSKNLSAEQRIAILTAQGMSKEEAKATLSTMGFATAEGVATASTHTLSGALKGLWATFKANPIGLIITGVTLAVSAFSSLTQAQEEAANKAKEAMQTAIQNAETYREEANSISELIKKYKELAQSDTQDATTREEIKGIQNDITKLVAQQADNLDLVNGKLDEELAKLHKIEKEAADKAVETASSAYHKAREAHDAAVSDVKGSFAHPGFDSNYAYIGKRDTEIEKILQDAGFSNNVGSGGWFGNTSYVFDNVRKTEDEQIIYIEGATDKAALVQEMLNAIKEAKPEDYAANDVYQALLAQRDAYLGNVDTIDTAADSLLNSLIFAAKYDSELAKITVDSTATFEQYRQKLIDIVTSSPELAEALSLGDLSKDDIAKEVESYLATLAQLEDYYTVPPIPQKLTFPELMADESFTKKVDAHTEKISTLKKALKSLQDGTFTNENFIDLTKTFPELGDDVSNLNTAINALIEDSNTQIFDDLGTYLEQMESDEDYTALVNLRDALINIDDAASDVINSLKMIQSVSYIKNLYTDTSSGFDLLGKIYSDVSNGEDFDYSSILGNENFDAAFGEFTEEYNNFISTIVNSPQDIAACQNAFNSLANAYLNNSDALKDVTDETRNATVSMLEQMGIANAAAIVDQKLAKDKERLKYATDEYADISYKEVLALYNEAKAGTVTQEVLAELAIEKAMLNQEAISTVSDIDQLISLASAANATTASIGRLTKAKRLQSQVESNTQTATSFRKQAEATEKEMAGYSSIYRNTEAYKLLQERYQYLIGVAEKFESDNESLSEDIEKLLSQPLEFNKLDPNDFEIDFDGGSSVDGTKDSKQAIDWITTAISRLNEQLNRLKNVANSAFKSLKTRLGATKDEISVLNKEMSTQEKAYVRYMKAANSVGLSDSLKKKVQNGTININTYDSATADKIQEYQDYYEKAIEALDRQKEIEEEINTLYKERFDLIQADYENQLTGIDNKKSSYQNELDKLDAQGYMGNINYYALMQDAEHQNIAILNNELKDLKKAFDDAMTNGDIEKESVAWYELKFSIEDVQKQIDEANLSLLEYADTIHEIEWGYFDFLEERISQLTQESDFLIDLMSETKLYDDKGQLSDNGMATMGLHTANYNVYMAQADQYAEEMLKIQKELADDPSNTKLIERREELLGLQQESILAAEDEKQAIVDMVEEGINLELESLQELIDSYKESLDSAKDLYDYQNQLADQTSDISLLQKQLSAYEGDLSEETQAKVQQLKVELENAEKDLEQTEYEHYISEQKQLLDSLYSEYEEILNQRLDNTDSLISDMIDATNSNADTINTTLQGIAEDVGYNMTDSMKSIWDSDISTVVSSYTSDSSSKLTSINTVLNSIYTSVTSITGQDGKDSSGGSSSGTNTQPTTPPSTSGNTPSSSNNTNTDSGNGTSGSFFIKKKDSYPKNKLDKNGSLIDRLKYNDFDASFSARTKYYSAMGFTGTYTGSSSQNSNMLKWMKVNGFSKGGYVADLQRIAARNGDDIFTVNTLKRGEAVLTQEQAAQFKKLTENLPQLQGIVDVSPHLERIRGQQQAPSTSVEYTNNNYIDIDRVQDYNDFVNQLRDDKKFERFIQSVTVDRLVGNSSLAKNKYRW